MRYLILIVIVILMGFIGMLACRGLIARRRELEWFYQALSLMETEMDFSRDPLPVALSRTGARIGGIVALVFHRASKILAESPVVGGEGAFLAALKEYRDDLSLNDEDLAVLGRFSCDLGLTDLEDQKKKLNFCAKAVELQLEAARLSEQKWKRICSVGGWMAGIVFALILI
ncbi:MAG: stage III sporulation protein AB [Bacillota bacterium]|nr:stage III sporulation protein AB [Bacillota bacterium]